MHTIRKAVLSLASLSLASLSLASLSLLGIAYPAAAQTTGTFTDNFLNPGGNTVDINAGIGAPRQSGTVIVSTPGGITYAEPYDTSAGDYSYDTQLDNAGDAATAGAINLLIATINRPYYGNDYVSPNESLAPAVGGTLTFSYGTIPNSDDFTGSYLGPQGTFQSSAGGIGFLLTKSGTVQVYENGVLQTLAASTVTGFSNAAYNTVVETYTNNGSSGVFSLSVDGQPLFTDPNAFALTDYHVSLDAYSTSGNGGVSYFNNLSIASVAPVAAPEPSQVSILGIGILGLAGMALTARKRSLRNS